MCYIVRDPYDALVYTGRHLFGARQRKDEFVGTIAESRIESRGEKGKESMSTLGRLLARLGSVGTLLGAGVSFWCPDCRVRQPAIWTRSCALPSKRGHVVVAKLPPVR